MTPIAGRVVAVTGGARGIGRATAAALARGGARVAIGDLGLAVAERTAGEIGAGVVALQLDVTDRDSFAAFLTGAEEHLGPLDVLVNNAGIMPIGRFADEDDAATRRMVDGNLHGVITGCKLALERMLPRGSGHLVNIASQAGRAGAGGLATYCATKHAVVGLSASLADELDGTGVRVSCVMPAVVRTELTAGVPSPRLIKEVGPEDVADVIAAVLERPRLNVHVPRNAIAFGPVAKAPRPVRKVLERISGLEGGVLGSVDPQARAAYEARVAEDSPTNQTINT